MPAYRINCPLCSWYFEEQQVIGTDIILDRSLSPEEYGHKMALEQAQRAEAALVEHFKGHSFAEWVSTCARYKCERDVLKQRAGETCAWLRDIAWEELTTDEARREVESDMEARCLYVEEIAYADTEGKP